MLLRKSIRHGLLVLVVGAVGNCGLKADPSPPPDITVPGSAAAPMAPVPADSGTPPPPPPTSLAAPVTPTDTTATVTLPSTAVTPAPTPFFPTGKLPFHVSVGLGEIYDDNIFIQPHKTSDFITQITLKGELKLGDQNVVDGNYLDAYYAPSGAIYASHSSEDYINQDLGLFYQHRFSRLTLSVDQTYAKETATSISIGNLVTSNVYSTLLKADYAYSDKLDITSSVSQVFTDYDTSLYTSSGEWVNDDYFLYKWDSKLSFGFGPKFGFLSFAGSPLQTYQQFLPRVIYNYSDKLTFSLDGGMEFRQYDENGHGDILTGIFDLSGTYHPWLDTKLSVYGTRHYDPGYGVGDDDYLATTVGLNGRQKFLRNFTFNLGFGYENDDYVAADVGFSGVSREDNYFFVSTGLDWTPNTWLTVSGNYKYQNDSSNFQAFSFDDNQLELSVETTY